MVIRGLAQMLMVHQSLFSLPWIGAAILLALPRADGGAGETLVRALLSIVAVVLARTAGMSLNRWIDRDIDRVNPRTSSRPLQSGLVKLSQVIALALASLSLLVLVAASLGGIFLMLSPLVVALLVLYSYTKRFTWGCHFVLGLIHAAAPILTYLAVAERMDASAIFLGLSAGLSIAASDMIYALQDMNHDQKVGLYSLPACFGSALTRKIANLFYLLGALALGLMGYYEQFQALFWVVWLLFLTAPWLIQVYFKEEAIALRFVKVATILPFLAFAATFLGQWVTR